MSTIDEERRALLKRRIARAEAELGIDNRTPEEQIADQLRAAEMSTDVDSVDGRGKRRSVSEMQAEALLQSRGADSRNGYWDRRS